ncbi:hypothetical protein, partial [Gottfriedia acidiceleris]|uniref:hypothetical protein n=1 Tax=Gottfriedia acidiceleris TaxID=371036 RepID=UPI002FFFF2CC
LYTFNFLIRLKKKLNERYYFNTIFHLDGYLMLFFTQIGCINKIRNKVENRQFVLLEYSLII